MKRTPLARLVACVVAALLIFLGAPITPAHANVTVAVELLDLRLTGTGPKDELVLTGRVTNNGAQPAFGVHVMLWRSRDPIRDPGVLAAVSSGTTVPWGERLAAKPDHYFKITSSTEPLDPGNSDEFVVRATLADLGFTTRGAAYLCGVQVLGTPDASSNYATIGRARTLVAVPAKEPVPLTNVVVLSSAPSKLAPNLFADDHLAIELDGRLDGLLTAAEASGNSWLIDPSLLDEVEDLADGYRVVDGQNTVPGTGATAAASWLARFDKLTSLGGGAASLFANPDVLGASRAKDPEVLARAVAATAAADLDPLPVVVLPRGGVADPAVVKYLARSGAAAMLTTSAGTGPVVARGSGGVRVLRAADLTAAGPGSESGPVQRAQRLLAEAVIAGSQLRLIDSLDALAASNRARGRWLAPRSLRTVLTQPRDGVPTYTPPADVQVLPPDHFRAIRGLAADLVTYAELSPASELTPLVGSDLTRAASGSWPDAAAARGYLRQLDALAGRAAISSKVQLDVSSRVVMSSRTNEFPVSVTNGLTEAIRVRVIMVSENPQRLAIPPSALVTVGPGQSLTLNVRPEASTNGLVNISAHVVTESGRRITPSQRITVDVTELGMIGWIIVISSGIVLVGATAWRIRQVRRTATEEDA